MDYGEYAFKDDYYFESVLEIRLQRCCVISVWILNRRQSERFFQREQQVSYSSYFSRRVYKNIYIYIYVYVVW